MGMKLAGIMAIILMVAGGGFAWYYQDSQKRIAILTENNAKLETAVATNEEALKAQQASFEAMAQENARLNEEFSSIRDRNRALENRLSRHDIGALANAKPNIAQRVLNQGTANAQRCMEIYSGAELTQKELEATKPSEINPECWRDANPNFNPDIQPEAWKRKNL